MARMTSTARTLAGGMMLALLATPAVAANPPPATFSATLVKAPKKPQIMQLGDIQWSCTGTRCRGHGTTGDVEAACRDLAAHTGGVKTFIASGRILANCRTPEAAPAAPVPKNKPPPPGQANRAEPAADGNPPAGSAAPASALGSSASVRAAAVAVPKATDLVIEEVTWVYAPPRDSATVSLVKEVQGSHGSAHQPQAASMILPSPKVKVTLRNAGTARWASSGKVVVVMRLGTPRELAERSGAGGRSGVSVVPGGSGSTLAETVAGSVPPFSGSGSIPGSLAPGERKTVQFKVKGTARNTHARENLRVELDKYYTMNVDLQLSGEDKGKNNGADLVFRLNRLGQAVEPALTQRETGPATRGTVEVRGPPGG